MEMKRRVTEIECEWTREDGREMTARVDEEQGVTGWVLVPVTLGVGEWVPADLTEEEREEAQRIWDEQEWVEP